MWRFSLLSVLCVLRYSSVFPSLNMAVKRREQALQDYKRLQSKVEKYEEKEKTGPIMVKLHQVQPNFLSDSVAISGIHFSMSDWSSNNTKNPLMWVHSAVILVTPQVAVFYVDKANSSCLFEWGKIKLSKTDSQDQIRSKIWLQ